MLKKVLIGALALTLVLAVIAAAQMVQEKRIIRQHGSGTMGMGACCGMGAGQDMGMGSGMRGGRGMGMRQRGMRAEQLLALADKLELTDVQREKLKALNEQFQMEQIDARAAIQKARVQMRSLMGSENSPTSDIDRAIDRIANLRADLAKRRIHHMADMKSVLTEKQREMLKELRAERGKQVRVRVIEKNGEQEIEKDVTPSPNPGGHGM